MQLIQVLLYESPTLVRMITKPLETEDKESFKALAEVTKFQRTTSKAEVVYSGIESILRSCLILTSLLLDHNLLLKCLKS